MYIGAFKFFLNYFFVLYVSQVSQEYKSVERTTALKIMILMAIVSAWLSKTWRVSRPKAEWAALILFSTYFLHVGVDVKMVPKYENWTTNWSVFGSSFNLHPKAFICYIICVC